MRRSVLVLMMLTACLISGDQLFATGKEENVKVDYPKVNIVVKDACNNEVCGDGYNINGSTYVPVRLVMESMGASVLWDSLTQTVSISPTLAASQVSDVNEDQIDSEDIYITDSQRIIEHLKNELDLYLLFDQNLSISYELYKISNEKQWITGLSKGKMVERKNATNKVINLMLTHQKEHNEKHVEVNELTKTVKNLNELIEYYSFGLNALERHINNNDTNEYKIYLLHRKLGIESLEKLRMNVIQLES